MYARGDIAGEIGELQVAQGVIPNEDVHPLLRRDEEGILLRLRGCKQWRHQWKNEEIPIPTNIEGSLKLGIRLAKLWTDDLKNKK